jgi:Putative zinc-finger
MNHDEAVRSMIAEKYLLNELSPEAREQFEEHFFQCTECADDVRAGAVFVDLSKAVFRAEESAAKTHAAPVTSRARRGWLWPALAVPVMAVLLAVIAYQNWVARPAPQVLSAAFVNIGSRGGTAPSVSAHSGEGFLIRLTIPPPGLGSSYLADVYGPGGKVEWSLPLPYTADNDNYFIQVPPGRHEVGIYTVAVRGIGQDGSSSEIGRSRFELRIVK